MTTAARTAEQRKPAAPGKNAPGLSSTPRSRRVAKAPPKGLATTPAKTIDAAALQEAFLKPRRTVLTRDVFLRSQGPKVVEIDLPNMGATVLMRRIDLLELARRGGEHWPLRSAVLKMIQAGGLTNDLTEGEALADTLDIAAAVALACIVVPPAAYLEAAAGDHLAEADALAAREAALLGVKASELRPFFVAEGEEPDEDQVVLRWADPDAEGDGSSEEGPDLLRDDEPGDAGYVHWADLIVILRMAHQFGPGALGRRFRGEAPEADALAALLALAGAGGTEA
jgi:hypothetical protein